MQRILQQMTLLDPLMSCFNKKKNKKVDIELQLYLFRPMTFADSGSAVGSWKGSL